MRVNKTIAIDPAFLRTVERAKWDIEEKKKKKIRILHIGSTRE